MHPLVLLKTSVIALVAAAVDGGLVRSRFDLTELKHARFRFAFVKVTCYRVCTVRLIPLINVNRVKSIRCRTTLRGNIATRRD